MSSADAAHRRGVRPNRERQLRDDARESRPGAERSDHATGSFATRTQAHNNYQKMHEINSDETENRQLNSHTPREADR